MNNKDNQGSTVLAGTRSRFTGLLDDQQLEDWIVLADACHVEASKPEVAARLVAYDWLAADQKDLGLSLGTCETLMGSIQKSRVGRRAESEEEKEARKDLRMVLDPVLKGARRSYPSGAPQRTLYGIGRGLANMSTRGLMDLVRYADAQLSQRKSSVPPLDTLKGLSSGEIAALGEISRKYKDAAWAQPDSLLDASEYLEFLRKEVQQTLNALRRDLQGAADLAYPHDDAGNARKRAAFGLPLEMPLIG